MQVQTLIAILKGFDPELDCVLPDAEYGDIISDVYQVKDETYIIFSQEPEPEEDSENPDDEEEPEEEPEDRPEDDKAKGKP